eukprot:1161975-Pelagomonas_calceolata.AAC.13
MQHFGRLTEEISSVHKKPAQAFLGSHWKIFSELSQSITSRLLECSPFLKFFTGNLTDGWQVLDVRKEVTFTDRHQLRSFACTFPHKASSSAQQQQAGSLAAGGEHAMPSPPALAHAHWRRFRLRITSTADPAAANSVQLAAWNLFGLPQPDPLNLTLLPSCSSLGAAGESGLEACQQAAHQVIQAKLACLLTTQQVELLLKVMANVANHPEDPRYRCAQGAGVAGFVRVPWPCGSWCPSFVGQAVIEQLLQAFFLASCVPF